MIKGLYKGFKYITHIFVVKEEEEEEIQIGLPTDVKHVAHIGVDGPSGSAPSWMNDFKAAPEFSSSLGSSPITDQSAKSTTRRREHASSLPTQQATSGQGEEELERDVVASDIVPMKARKKHKRKKAKSVSSPKASSSASSSPSHPHVSKSSRPTKSKLKNNTHDDDDHQHLVSGE